MILAIDLASRQTGWALFTKDKELHSFGIIQPRPLRLTAEQRLPVIEKDIEAILKQYSISHVILENPVGGAEDSKGPDKNWQTVFILAMTHGVVRNILEKYNKSYSIISPSTWQNRLGFFKRDRTGRKAAAKQYAEEKYKISNQEQDIYDAICLHDAYIYMEEFKAEQEKPEVSAF